MSKIIIAMEKGVCGEIRRNAEAFPRFNKLDESLVYYDECESVVDGLDATCFVVPEYMTDIAMSAINELRTNKVAFDAYSGCDRIETSGYTGAVVMGETGFIPRALLNVRQKCYLIAALAEKLREVGGEDVLSEAIECALEDMEDANIPADEVAVNNLCGMK